MAISSVGSSGSPSISTARPNEARDAAPPEADAGAPAASAPTDSAKLSEEEPAADDTSPLASGLSNSFGPATREVRKHIGLLKADDPGLTAPQGKSDDIRIERPSRPPSAMDAVDMRLLRATGL